jgi:hypothetical protein
MYWDKKWHRLRLTQREASQAHLDRAIELNTLALRVWDGPGKSFHEFSDDEHWVSITFRGDGVAVVELSEPEDRAELLSHVLIWAVDHLRVVVGGAWGGVPPPWVDALNRWWFRIFEEPHVPGPLWLLVAPPATNRLLGEDAEARLLAVDVTELQNGALWRLVREPADLTGQVVGKWSAVMNRLGLLPTDPPVRDLVDGYLSRTHPLLPTRWP